VKLIREVKVNIEGKRFLVIGGAGFIGSQIVVELLKHNVAEVIIYDNFARGKYSNIEKSLEDPRCTLFADGGDIREVDVLQKAMKDVDGVFHVAAMWLLHCKDYPRTAFDVNIQGTFNVLEAAVNSGVKRMVYSSSASVYGDAVEIPMTEEHPFNNRNFYGATKIAGEAMCRAFYDRYALNYVGLRYMNVYGPYQDQTAAYTGVIPIMMNKIEANETPEINGDGSQAYDFIAVSDVARANVLAMQSESTDQFYNIGTGIQTTIKYLCETILDITNSSLEVIYRPYSENDQRQLVQNRIGATQKSKKDLHFEYKVELIEGLRDLWEWRKRTGGIEK
jgi:UDP-glucose 4-epimerase